VKRNAIAENGWVLETLDDLSVCDSFDCGEKDLNEYFQKDVRLHRQGLLTRTYCFYESSTPDVIIALLDFCNDAIHLEKPLLPGDIYKSYPTYPAVKLTRLGVSKDFHRQGLGTYALNMAKKFFVTDNRTGCRFITVDAYKEPGIYDFYNKNGFLPFPKKVNKKSETIPLFYNLKPLTEP
jgi:GNAT superfamily N-acetyltransferase